MFHGCSVEHLSESWSMPRSCCVSYLLFDEFKGLMLLKIVLLWGCLTERAH